MKYILMMNAAFGTGDWEIFKWKPEEIKAHVAYWNTLNAELREAGFTPDPRVPLTEYNRPQPGAIRAGGPVIYEAAFERSEVRG